MPKFEQDCSGFTLKVKDMDHPPPRCHVSGSGFRDEEIDLYDLRRLGGGDRAVRSAELRDCLRRHQDAMLKAWDDVEER